MSDVECFWIEETDRAQVRLRRFTFGSAYADREARPCPASPQGHDADAVWLAQIPFRVPPHNGREVSGLGSSDRDLERLVVENLVTLDEYESTEPAWPVTCARCEHRFADDDEWQVNVERLYRRADQPDDLRALRMFPPGAMYDGSGWNPWRGPDGRCIVVRLPDGVDWPIDAPSTDTHEHWTRSGTPPKVTARPSIQTARYHGFLTDGVLRGV